MDSFTLYLCHVSTSYLQLLQHPCSCHSHILFKDCLLFISCNFANLHLLIGYSVLISVTKSVCLFIVTSKLRYQTIFTAKRIYLVGHVLFRKRKICSMNLSSGKFISFQYFSSFSFRLITLKKEWNSSQHCVQGFFLFGIFIFVKVSKIKQESFQFFSFQSFLCG